jgi:hypothetical protein
MGQGSGVAAREPTLLGGESESHHGPEGHMVAREFTQLGGRFERNHESGGRFESNHELGGRFESNHKSGGHVATRKPDSLGGGSESVVIIAGEATSSMGARLAGSVDLVFARQLGICGT